MADNPIIDRGSRDPDEVLHGWLQYCEAAGGLLLPIDTDGHNAKPPSSWNKPEWGRALPVAAALDRIRAGRNVGVGMAMAAGLDADLLLIDADHAEAADSVRAALGDVATLATRTPRGEHYILRLPNAAQRALLPSRQLQCKPLGIDTRASLRGYGMTPGSYRDMASYRRKWAKLSQEDREKELKTHPAPTRSGRWYYQVLRAAPVAEAPDGIFRLLETMSRKNAAVKDQRRESRQYGARTWHLTDLEKMLGAMREAADGSRDEWLSILFGAKAQFGDEARASVEAWSQTSKKFDQDDFTRSWDGASQDGGRTFGTVVWKAVHEYGYSLPGPGRRGRKAPSVPAKPVSLPPPAPGRRSILYEEGKEQDCCRKAVKALVEDGAKDDRRSIYASPVTATATGETTGGIVVLRTQPNVDGGNKATWKGDPADAAPVGAIRFPPGEVVIEGAPPKVVKTLLADRTDWRRMVYDRRGSYVKPWDPTDQIAANVIERYRLDAMDGSYPRFRVLNGIVDSPTLRADGSLIDAYGYDPQSGLFAAFDPNGWNIPKQPTREDATIALRRLHEVVEESLFATKQHRAVWVAAVLTIVAREYARGNVPMFAVSANQRGAGKGTLVDMATAIATNRPATKWSPPAGRRSDAEAEEDKRLTTVALNGTRVLCYDNVAAGEPIGTPALDRALTAGADGSMGVVSGRVLGASVEAKAPWRAVVFATGNNLLTRGDLDRRVLLCRLHTDEIRPESRMFARQSPVDYCLANRRELLTAALTIVLAHKQAMDRGETSPLPPWGSFVYWSDRIRSAVVWADPEEADPKDTSDEVHAKAHPEQAETLAFLSAWHDRFGGGEMQSRDVDFACREGEDGYHADLAAAANDLPLSRPTGKAAVNTRSLGAWLAKVANRPGPYVLREGDRPRRWFVEKTEAETKKYPPEGLETLGVESLLKDWGIEAGGDYPPGSLMVFEYDLESWDRKSEEGPPLIAVRVETEEEAAARGLPGAARPPDAETIPLPLMWDIRTRLDNMSDDDISVLSAAVARGEEEVERMARDMGCSVGDIKAAVERQIRVRGIASDTDSGGGAQTRGTPPRGPQEIF